jgi:hypothetical protein
MRGDTPRTPRFLFYYFNFLTIQVHEEHEKGFNTFFIFVPFVSFVFFNKSTLAKGVHPCGQPEPECRAILAEHQKTPMAEVLLGLQGEEKEK